MKIKSQLVRVLLLSGFLTSGSIFAQFSGFEDAPTRRGSANINSGTLEGLFMEVIPGETPDAKTVTVTFVVSKLASAFFDYYDPVKKEVVVDLYDTRIGESRLDTIREHPIDSSWIEDTQVDLNKDVAGLRPDFRDVTRIHLSTRFNIPYEIEEEFGVINLKFKWSKKLEKKFNRSRTAIYWKAPMAMAVIGGLGYGIYVWKFQDTEDPPPEDLVGQLPLPGRP